MLLLKVIFLLSTALALTCALHPIRRLDRFKFFKAKRDLLGLINKELDNIGGFVRLAFHDCIGKGGCDGCLAIDRKANAGLKTYVDRLNPYYDGKYADIMSRADFYQLAAIVALKKSSEEVSHKFNGRRFRIGRQDCPTSPNEDDTVAKFPSANFEFKQVVKFFKDAFKLSRRETIALLGAHTLGRCRSENSGFEGPWAAGVKGPITLNNFYYTSITDIPWNQRVLANGNVQWQVPKDPTNTPGSNRTDQPIILLNVDAALSLDLGLDDKGVTTCKMCARGFADNDSTCCQPNKGDAICLEFAKDNQMWIKEFEDVFYKMTSTNPNKLFPVLFLNRG